MLNRDIDTQPEAAAAIKKAYASGHQVWLRQGPINEIVAL